ncbi:hypothetical protein ACHJH3_06745 [Campylobacter sp. MOP7]|uniref:hypothetical protein n=1 Tax=Campylobacter canis TaxID=3378588 RepID=UPI00387E4D8E
MGLSIYKNKVLKPTKKQIQDFLDDNYDKEICIFSSDEPFSNLDTLFENFKDFVCTLEKDGRLVSVLFSTSDFLQRKGVTESFYHEIASKTDFIFDEDTLDLAIAYSERREPLARLKKLKSGEFLFLT